MAGLGCAALALHRSCIPDTSKRLGCVLIALGWFSEHGQPFDAQATGFYRRLRHFVERRVPESWSREVVQGPG